MKFYIWNCDESFKECVAIHRDGFYPSKEAALSDANRLRINKPFKIVNENKEVLFKSMGYGVHGEWSNAK